jgi:hypothetical protein
MRMLRRQFIALCLLLTIVSSTLSPVFARPTQAFIPVIDPLVAGLIAAQTSLQAGTVTYNIALRILKYTAMTVAQAMIQQLVASTVRWAQSGFNGNPAYVTNPAEYFTNIADGVAGQFIQGSDLGLLCSPFQASIKLSLTQQYYEPRPFQCTLTGVIGNIENFYGDFSQGGWDAWFSMTQEQTNNPYGAYLKAKIELDSQIASAVGLKKSEYDINNGFLSWQECAIGKTTKYDINGRPDGEMCILGQEKTVTPGSVISAQLNQTLPAGLNKLINAHDIDEIINAFAAGILQRYVFGSKGLFNKDPYQGEEGKAVAGLLQPWNFPKSPTEDPTGNPSANYSSCVLACSNAYCSVDGNTDALTNSCTPELDACLTDCQAPVVNNPQNAVTHSISGSTDERGTQVYITATVPNLPNTSSLHIRVDGTDKFYCTSSPCTYGNRFPDGTYTYDAFYWTDVQGDPIFLTGGSFTLPVPATTPTPPAGPTGPKASEAKNWTLDEWKSYVFNTLFPSKSIGSGWTTAALNATRADLNALGADWQFSGSGGLRPRLYLPSPSGGPLTGNFNKFVDMAAGGSPEGSPWQWNTH